MDSINAEHAWCQCAVGNKFWFSTSWKILPAAITNQHKGYRNDPCSTLSRMGLAVFEAFERGDYAGRTYGNTYFVHASSEMNESLHFHELVHVLQWEHLGWDQFMKAYALGLLRFGYLGSPLEVMARSHQSRMASDPGPYDVQENIRRELDVMRVA